MPDSSNQHGDRYEGLRDLQRGQRGQRRDKRTASSRRRAEERRPLGAHAAGAGGAWANGAGDHGGRPSGRRSPGGRGRAGRAAAAERLTGLQVPRRHHWPRRFLVIVNVVVAFILVCGVAAFAYVEVRLGQVNRISLPGLTAARSSGPFTVLIVGSDTRELGGSGNQQFGSQSETPGQRSDTIMLARVVPATSRMTLLSIPRDLWVDIPGMGYSKINSAFNTGPALLIRTIEKDLGIPINHFVEINFDSFRQITDAVGGVKFYFPTPARDAYSLLDVPKAGCVNLTGNQALGFVRSRHYQYFEDGQWQTQGLSDLARIQRQQAFVKKMIKKAETKFTNPFALNGVVGALAKNLTVDKRFSTSLMIGLAEDFRRADVAGIPTETLPVQNYFVDYQDALSLQQPQAQQMITAFNHLGDKTSSKSGSGSGSKAVPPSKVAVEVANGSGVTGQAAQAGADVRKLGYKVTVTSTSPGYGFTGNEIEYAPDSLAAAQHLEAKLAGGATLVESGSLSPTPYNLELITGADWAGLASAHHSTSSTTAPSTTTTTYLLPGPQPTKAELAAC